MESDKDKKYQELRNNHLSMLMQYGRNNASVIASAIELLKQDLNEMELSEDAKTALSILKNTAKKQIELLDLVLEEQQTFLGRQSPSDE
jgi:hypothetical protein